MTSALPHMLTLRSAATDDLRLPAYKEEINCQSSMYVQHNQIFIIEIVTLLRAGECINPKAEHCTNHRVSTDPRSSSTTTTTLTTTTTPTVYVSATATTTIVLATSTTITTDRIEFTSITTTVINSQTSTVTEIIGTTTITDAAARREILQRADQALSPLLPAVNLAVQSRTSSWSGSGNTVTVTQTAPAVFITTIVATMEASSAATTTTIDNTSITTQEVIVATVTMDRVVATTTIEAEATATVHIPPRTGHFGLGIDSGFVNWAYLFISAGVSTRAAVIQGSPVGPANADTFSWTGGGQPNISVVGSSGAPTAIGYSLYYDPVNAIYGPSTAGFAGHVSRVVAVAPGDPNNAATSAIECTFNIYDQLECIWGPTGLVGKWQYCGGFLSLVEPEFDTGGGCALGGNVPFLVWDGS